MKNMLFVLAVLLPVSLVAAEKKRSLPVPLETIHGAVRRCMFCIEAERRICSWCQCGYKEGRRPRTATLLAIEESPEVSPSGSPRESKVSVPKYETKS